MPARSGFDDFNMGPVDRTLMDHNMMHIYHQVVAVGENLDKLLEVAALVPLINTFLEALATGVPAQVINAANQIIEKIEEAEELHGQFATMLSATQTARNEAQTAASQAAAAMNGSVRFDSAQTLTGARKTQARSNIGLGSAIASEAKSLTNWNDITESGHYYGPVSTPNAPSAARYSGEASFVDAGTGTVVARRTEGGNELWIRRKYGSVWSAWTQLPIAVSGPFDMSEGRALTPGYFGHGDLAASLPAGLTSLDGLTLNGAVYSVTATQANTLGGPINQAGILETFGYSSATAMQRYTSLRSSGGDVYVRWMWAGVWQAWVTMAKQGAGDTAYATKAELAEVASPRNAPMGASVPVATDGRTLHRLRRRIGQIRTNVSGGFLRMALFGDSWAYINDIPAALLDLFNSKLSAGQAVGSFIQAEESVTHVWPGVTFTRTGTWVHDDGSDPTATMTYGSGVDGNVLRASGNGATLNMGGVAGNAMTIYTLNNGANWRYRIDDGSWVAVTDSSDKAIKATVITGLTSGDHTIQIEKTSSAGILAFAGLRNTPTAKIVLQKLGNGGLSAHRAGKYISNTVSMWANLTPDLVVIFLGTNDYRLSDSGPAAFLTGIQRITNAIRAGYSDAGIIFVLPPYSDGTVYTPQEAYREVLYKHCLETGCEMFNMLDSWGPYNAQLFSDSLHLNAAGAAVCAHQLNHHFIGL